MNSSPNSQDRQGVKHEARIFLSLVALSLLALANAGLVRAQRRDPIPSRPDGFTLYGDFEVDEKEADEQKPISFTVILYTRSGNIFDRQTIGSKGRYRFINVPPGQYEIRVEAEGTEVARQNVMIVEGQLVTDIRQDISLEWKRNRAPGNSSASADTADQYVGSRVNADRFERAMKARSKKDYAEAVALLREIIDNDPKDFQAWTELANLHFLQKSLADAENAYLRALDAHPGFFPALINLGRLEVAEKRYEVAVEALSRALKAQPKSADANYLLGESYLQLKKGSLAVPYLSEALRLDPQGMAEVHLRLALLYNGAGMKDKAAAEYEEFLKTHPNYVDRKRLEQYIAENKKR